MLTLIGDKIVPIDLALIDYKLVSVLTLIADKIVPIGLALIDYKLVLVLTLIADEIVPIGLASIDFKLVSGFDIDMSFAWIDTILDKILGVRH